MHINDIQKIFGPDATCGEFDMFINDKRGYYVDYRGLSLQVTETDYYTQFECNLPIFEGKTSWVMSSVADAYGYLLYLKSLIPSALSPKWKMIDDPSIRVPKNYNAPKNYGKVLSLKGTLFKIHLSCMPSVVTFHNLKPLEEDANPLGLDASLCPDEDKQYRCQMLASLFHHKWKHAKKQFISDTGYKITENELSGLTDFEKFCKILQIDKQH